MTDELSFHTHSILNKGFDDKYRILVHEMTLMGKSILHEFGIHYMKIFDIQDSFLCVVLMTIHGKFCEFLFKET